MSAHLSIQVLEHVGDWQIQLPAGLFNGYAPRQRGAKNRVRHEIDQIIALSAGTIGLPSAVAVFSWVNERLSPGE